MLEDRDYMRQPEFRERRISMTVAILILNTVVFLVQMAASNYLRGRFIENHYFALSVEGLKSGFVWQLLTYQFMHASWLHLIFNSVAIFFFGRLVEMNFGRARFLVLYFSSGIIGGVLQMFFALLIPQYFGGGVVGASAGGYGLVAAFAVMNWTERFTLFIYFIPVAMRGKTLLWVSIALAVVVILTPGSGIANAAHLGGILAGFFFARQMLRGNWPQWKFPSRRAEPREFAATRASKRNFWRAGELKPGEELSADEFLQREVDPILDKISARGIQSLTKREHEILEKARAKMQRR